MRVLEPAPAPHREPEAAVRSQPALARFVNRSLGLHPGAGGGGGSARGAGRVAAGRWCRPGSAAGAGAAGAVRRAAVVPAEISLGGEGAACAGAIAPVSAGQRNERPGSQHDHSPATTAKPNCATHRARLLSSSGWQIVCHLPADRRGAACPLAIARTPPWAAEITVPANVAPAAGRQSPIVKFSLVRWGSSLFGSVFSVPPHPAFPSTANCEVA